MPTPKPSPSKQQLLEQLAAARQQVAELEEALAEHDVPTTVDDALFTQTLFEHLPDFVYFKDRERRFVRVSKSFELLFGRPTSEILGRRDEDLFPAEIAGATVDDDRRVIEQGTPLLNKLEGGEVSPGVESWVLTTKIPWRDASGSIQGLFGISRDVTQQRKLENEVRHSERRLRIISETVPFPIAATRIDDGTILYANRAFAEFIDVDVDELVGSKVPDYYVDPREREALIARVRAQGHVTGAEIRLRRHDGAIRIASSAIIPLEIDGVAALMGAGADVTELKAQEARLRELGEQKDLLLREVNHRVRNNLATLTALVRQQSTGASGAVREALVRIDRTIQGLAAVHTMLSVGGWQPLDLCSLCRSVVQATLADAQPPPRLQVSGTSCRAASQPAHQLALVMSELTSNSLKHGLSDSGLQVEVSTEVSGDRVVITYRDNGPGFPDDVLEGARGVGLRVVEGLVEFGLSGHLALHNERGAVSTLDLPSLDEHGHWEPVTAVVASPGGKH